MRWHHRRPDQVDGSATAVNVVRATVDALKKLEEPEEIAARRGMSLEEVAPDALLRARAEGIAEARKAREEAQPRLLRRTVSDD
mgnify:FL=1